MARYHGLAVPLMPEKRVVGNQSAAFIEERMAGLEQFMLLLLSNAYLRLDETLQMFLRVKSPSEFEQKKKAAMAGEGANPASNAGLARWFGVLRSLPCPSTWTPPSRSSRRRRRTSRRACSPSSAASRATGRRAR